MGSQGAKRFAQCGQHLASANIPFDTVCFHCQQVAEKPLKAALAAKSVLPPRTHILVVLLDKIAPILPSVEILREDLVILTPYAVSARYPDDETDKIKNNISHEGTEARRNDRK